MDNQALTFIPAHQLTRLIADRKISSVELTEFFLRRIEQINPSINAYLTVDGDQALDQALKADQDTQQKSDIGPLHGIPIGIKDLTETAGLRTTFGSKIHEDYIPKVDDLTASKIRSSGAIILGKTNTPEFGHSATTENVLGDACRNPWDISKTSGGSSGGATAGLAAGLHPIASGSDGGGSIRIPASFCGVFGIKPTQSRVARNYYPPGGWRMFSQNGPLSNNVRDSAILLEVMAGPDESDPLTIKENVPNFSSELETGIEGLKVGWSPDFGGAPMEEEVQEITASSMKVFSDLGAEVHEIDLDLDHELILQTFDTIWISDQLANFSKYIESHSEVMSSSFLRELKRGTGWTASQLALALRELEWHKHRIDKIVTTFDVLITPTTATTAFKVGERPSIIGGIEVPPWFGFTPFSYPFNMSGHPAASIPCGFNSDGMPVGLQVIGHRWQESKVLGVCSAFEKAKPWAGVHPAISG